MAVAARRLLMGEEALRQDEVEAVAGPGHGDIEEAPLLLDLGRRAGGEVGGDAAVYGVEEEDRAPFLPLGGMDGGEDQIVLVLHRRAGAGAGRVRRVERQLGEEFFARRGGGGDGDELAE